MAADRGDQPGGAIAVSRHELGLIRTPEYSGQVHDNTRAFDETVQSRIIFETALDPLDPAPGNPTRRGRIANENPGAHSGGTQGINKVRADKTRPSRQYDGPRQIPRPRDHPIGWNQWILGRKNQINGGVSATHTPSIPVPKVLVGVSAGRIDP
jgi:hypothetical protein